MWPGIIVPRNFFFFFFLLPSNWPISFVLFFSLFFFFLWFFNFRCFGELPFRVERVEADWASICRHRAIFVWKWGAFFNAILVKAHAKCAVLAEYGLAVGARDWIDREVLVVFRLLLAFRALALLRGTLVAFFEVIAVFVTMHLILAITSSSLAIVLFPLFTVLGFFEATIAAAGSFFLALDSCDEARAPAKALRTVRANKLLLALAFCPGRPEHCRLFFRSVYAVFTIHVFLHIDPRVNLIDIIASRTNLPIVEDVNIFLTELCFQHMVHHVGYLNYTISFVLGRFTPPTPPLLVKTSSHPLNFS